MRRNVLLALSLAVMIIGMIVWAIFAGDLGSVNAMLHSWKLPVIFGLGILWVIFADRAEREEYQDEQ